VRYRTLLVGLTVLLVASSGPATATQAKDSLRTSSSASSASAASAAQTASRAIDCWTDAVAGYSWTISYSNCTVFGSAGTKMSYTWQLPPYSNGRVCVEGVGYPLKNGARYEKWYSIGCGTGGFANGIPWGPAAGTPRVRAKVQPGFFGGAYTWIQGPYHSG
jgi:hypothetical protein